MEIKKFLVTRNPSLREPKSITILNLIFLISGLLMKRVTIVLFLDISIYICSRICFVLHKCLPLFLIYRAVKNASYPESALKKHVQFAYHLYIYVWHWRSIKWGHHFFPWFFFQQCGRENVIRKKKEKGRRYPIKARLFNYYIGVGVVIHTINKAR